MLQQPGDGGVVQTRPEDAFQAGVELGEQAAHPVAGAGGLGSEVLAEGLGQETRRADEVGSDVGPRAGHPGTEIGTVTRIEWNGWSYGPASEALTGRFA